MYNCVNKRQLELDLKEFRIWQKTVRIRNNVYRKQNKHKYKKLRREEESRKEKEKELDEGNCAVIIGKKCNRGKSIGKVNILYHILISWCRFGIF
jgi:hypothetical protein